MKRNIYLVRHGQTDWNLQGLWQGFQGPGLNDTGREQSELAASALRETGASVLYSSDLPRAMETAEIIGQKLGGLQYRCHTGLRERGLGPLAGKKTSEILEEYPNLEFSHGILGTNNIPGAEEWDSYVQRCVDCFNELASASEGDMILVTHGGVILVIAQYITGSWDTGIVKNGAVLKISEENGKFTMETLDHNTK